MSLLLLEPQLPLWWNWASGTHFMGVLRFGLQKGVGACHKQLLARFSCQLLLGWEGHLQ